MDDDGWLAVGAMNVLGLDMQVPLASFYSSARYIPEVSNFCLVWLFCNLQSLQSLLLHLLATISLMYLQFEANFFGVALNI